MPKTELRPCPLCKSEADFSMGETGDGKPWEYVECIGCGAMVESADTWNTRPAEDALQADREMLHRLISKMRTDEAQTIEEVIEGVGELQGRVDALKQEAVGHARESRTQRATVCEIYQFITGSTGEPGDWNGARPVIDLVTDLRTQLAAAEGMLDEVEQWTKNEHEITYTDPLDLIKIVLNNLEDLSEIISRRTKGEG